MGNDLPSSSATSRWERAADKLTGAIPYATGAAILIPSAYFVWFIFQGQSISTDTADWGTFGDFVGGTLNPIVAFFALLWLMVSVGLQRDELKATRRELGEAATAQKKTAQHYEDMKGIEDCRIYVESMINMIVANRGTKYQSLLGHAESTRAPLQKKFRTENDEYLQDLSNKVLSIKKSMENWELLHGENHCYAVEFHKVFLKDLVLALWQLLKINDDAMLFFTNEKNIFSVSLESVRQRREELANLLEAEGGKLLMHD